MDSIIGTAMEISRGKIGLVFIKVFVVFIEICSFKKFELGNSGGNTRKKAICLFDSETGKPYDFLRAM